MEAAPGRAADARPPRARRRGRRVLPRPLEGGCATTTASRQGRAALGGLDLNATPDGVGGRGRTAAPVLPTSGRRSARSSRRSSTARTSPATSCTVQRRPPAPCSRLPRRALPDERPSRLADRREARLADRLQAVSIFHELVTRSRRSRAAATLALRPPWPLFVDDRVLEPPARGGDRGLPVHRVAARPPLEDDLEAPPLERQAPGRQGLRRLVSAEHDQLGSVELGGWTSCSAGRTSTASSGRSRRTRSSRSGRRSSRRGSSCVRWR